MSSSVLFLLPYPLHHAPSQRFRVEAFFPLLQRRNISFRTHCFLGEGAWNVLYKNGSAMQKAWAVLRGFLMRLLVVLFVAPRYEFVFIHREAAPLGPPVFEWLLAKVLRKRIIYDFDDAIWIPNVSETNRLAASVKCFWKVGVICKWAFKIAAGNDYLASFALQHNKRVVVVPTCVDTENRYNRIKEQTTRKPVIGWTGSHSTLPYLDIVYPILQQLAQSFEFEFLVICNQPPAFNLQNLRYLPWKEASEIDDLLKIDIGLMPLQADEWSEGKCGFKIIQYLALGIPAVASPVGVNKTILQHGTSGYLCETSQEWYESIERLLKDAALRQAMGWHGRQTITEAYSIQAHSDRFTNLFETCKLVVVN